jgi:glucans biosynthesis protein C
MSFVCRCCFLSQAPLHISCWQKRGIGSFIGLRFRRLLVPLIFSMLVIIERLTQGFKGSFADFYPSIFTTGSYPNGKGN